MAQRAPIVYQEAGGARRSVEGGYVIRDDGHTPLRDLPISSAELTPEVLQESDLESAILSKLSQFLLELGKGFAFVARQTIPEDDAWLVAGLAAVFAS